MPPLSAIRASSDGTKSKIVFPKEYSFEYPMTRSYN